MEVAKLDFGALIRRRRRELEWSQEEAAKRSSLTRPMWAKLESGASGTRRETVYRIASALGIEVNEALIAAGYAPEYAPVSGARARFEYEPESAPEDADLARVVRRVLDERDKEAERPELVGVVNELRGLTPEQIALVAALIKSVKELALLWTT